MPPEPSVTSACQKPRRCTLRYSSAELPKSLERPGPKSTRPAMYCPGVKLVLRWKWIVDICDSCTSLDVDRRTASSARLKATKAELPTSIWLRPPVRAKAPVPRNSVGDRVGLADEQAVAVPAD